MATRRLLVDGNNGVGAVAEGSADGAGKAAPDPPAHQRPAIAANTGDAVTATWPRQLYCPFAYNSYEVGPYSSVSSVRPGETRSAALRRVQDELDEFAEQEVVRKRDQFLESYKGLMDKLGRVKT